MNARKRQFRNNETEQKPSKKYLPPSSSQSLRWVDEEIYSSGSDDDDEGAAVSDLLDSNIDEETTEQKRIRLYSTCWAFDILGRSLSTNRDLHFVFID
jgi:hypothetical protein